MIKIKHVEISPFLTNCYLAIDKGTSQAALIDPGDEPDVISRFIEQAGVEVKYLLATHGHVDHVGAACEMSKRLGLGLHASPMDAVLMEKIPEACRMYGLKSVDPPTIEHELNNGDELPLGEERLGFLHAPGHSPGSMIIQAGDRDLIVGDVIFARSIGRTDLPGGSMSTLRNTIMNVLLPLGDEMRIHPGHGPATTIGWEKTANPFILDWS